MVSIPAVIAANQSRATGEMTVEWLIAIIVFCVVVVILAEINHRKGGKK